jgi:hypothetical protein
MTNPRAARAARRRRIRHLVIGGILFALLAGLALNLRLMLDPQEIRRRATDALAELFVGPVSLERAEVRLPNTVILHGVEVRRARDDPEPALVVSRVHVRFSVISLLIGRSLPRRITFDGPSLDMERRADGTLDLTDLLRPREPEETVETLPRILLRDGQLRLRDDRVLGPDRVLEVTSVWLQGDPDGAFEGGGTVEGLGRLAFRADWRGSAWARLDGVRLEAPLERYLASRHVAPLADLGAEGPVALELLVEAGSEPRLRVEIDGASLHPAVPGRPAGVAPRIENVRGSVLLRGGGLVLEDLTAEVLGAPLTVRGTIRDLADEPAVDVSLRTRDILLGREVWPLLSPEILRVFDAYRPWLRGDLTVNLRRQGRRDAPLDTEVVLDLTDGTMRYLGYVLPETGKRGGFPYLLNEMTGRIHFRDKTLEIVAARGRHGAVPLQAAGSVCFQTLSTCDVDVSILARDVPVDQDLRDAFGERAGYVLDPFGIDGHARRVHIHITQSADGPPASSKIGIDIHLDGQAGIRPREFPLPVTAVRGRVNVGPDPELADVERVTLEAVTGEGPGGSAVRLDGWIRDWGSPREENRFDVSLRDLPLDEGTERLLAAAGAPEDVRALWSDLAPRGRVDATATLEDGPDRGRHAFRLSPRAVRLRGLPDLALPLEDAFGLIESENGHLALAWARARLADAVLLARARLDENETRVELRARDLALDGAIRDALAALEPRAAETWDRLGVRPESLLDLEVEARMRPSTPTEVLVRVDRPRLRLRPSEDRTVTVDEGRVEAELSSGRFRLLGVRGRINDAAIQVAGGFDGTTEEWRISTEPLDPRSDLLDLVPAGIREAIAETLTGSRLALDPLRIVRSGDALSLDGTRLVMLRRPGTPEGLALHGKVRIPVFAVTPDGEGGTTIRTEIELAGLSANAAVPLEDLRGTVTMRGATGEAFRLDGQIRSLEGGLWGRRLENGIGTIVVREGDLRLESFQADLEGGRLEVDLVTDLVSGSVRAGIDLRELPLERFHRLPGGGRSSSVSGRLDGRLDLEHPGGSLAELRGGGKVRIREAELWDVPLFTSIFTALSAVPPIEYRPVFHSADVAFRVEGSNVRIEDMEFRSDMVSLERGRGTVSLFGDVDLTLVPKVRTIDIPGISDLWSLIKRDLLYRLHVQGSLERPRAELEPLPFLHGKPSPGPRVVPEFQGKLKAKPGLRL